MRCYVEKPRTQGGWKGFAFDPNLNNTQDIEAGLFKSRSLFYKLTRLKVPIATEFLDHATSHYLDDFVSWGCIGARTTTSQIHRQLASSLPLPIGFKNTTDGDIQAAIDGMISASTPHTFIGVNLKGQLSLIESKGNKNTHLILRGSLSAPNYDKDSLNKCLHSFKKKGVSPKILIDCSHDNSRKIHENQITVFQTCIDHILNGNTFIKGLLLESHLFEGKQKMSATPLKYGVSITDSCLGFDATKDLIYEAYAKWQQESLSLFS
jgi:3-deoxy-7-phosphoheptulonate synthase